MIGRRTMDIAGFERLGISDLGHKATEVHEENDGENKADPTSMVGDLEAVAISRPTVKNPRRVAIH